MKKMAESEKKRSATTFEYGPPAVQKPPTRLSKSPESTTHFSQVLKKDQDAPILKSYFSQISPFSR
jgi:hypothetical protein